MSEEEKVKEHDHDWLVNGIWMVDDPNENPILFVDWICDTDKGCREITWGRKEEI